VPQQVQINDIGLERVIVPQRQCSRVDDKRQIGWRAAELGLQFGQRPRQPLQVFFRSAVTQVNVVSNPGAAEQRLGLAADYNEFDVVFHEQIDDPFKRAFVVAVGAFGHIQEVATLPASLARPFAAAGWESA